jgi:hypothetical protein
MWVFWAFKGVLKAFFNSVVLKHKSPDKRKTDYQGAIMDLSSGGNLIAGGGTPTTPLPFGVTRANIVLLYCCYKL